MQGRAIVRNSKRFRRRGPSPEVLDTVYAVLVAIGWAALALLLLSTLNTQIGG
jgi:hypothetical protein